MDYFLSRRHSFVLFWQQQVFLIFGAFTPTLAGNVPIVN
jgi:hypothetical protein